MSAISTVVRSMLARGDNRRDAGLTVPANIVRVENVPYGTAKPGQQVLDVYRPAGTEQQLLPVIVSVHGGGYVYGDKDRYQWYCMSLAQRGFAVVNFTYRLAPETKHPGQLEDVSHVFQWVLDHAEEYHLDQERIFAVGDSAGAHLLSLFCCLCTNAGLRRRYFFAPPQGFRPKAVALNCGMYRFTKEQKKGYLSSLLWELLPKRGAPEELHSINTVEWINSKFPPSFVVSAVEDFLLPEAKALAPVLSENGVPWKLQIYGDCRQRLGHVFHCDARSAAAQQCNDDKCAFFRSYC